MTSTDTPENLEPLVIDRQELRDAFREDILGGLALAQKATPAKHLYDARGSELFDRICELEDYYPTRTEALIFDEHLPTMAELIGPGAVVVEPGSGDGSKAARLLEALDEPAAFVPIEISQAALTSSAEMLSGRFPGVRIVPVCADFHTSELPEDVPASGRVVFFPGSTIGNMEHDQRAELLRGFAALAGPGGLLLIGFDLVKPRDVLELAYDDREGVTAEFNLNLLRRINETLDGGFDLDAFEHRAVWVEPKGRVEMRLVSRRDQRVEAAGEAFDFEEGEHIHTESSHKFTPSSFGAEAAASGLDLVRHWTDPREWFCVALYRVRAG